MPVNKNKAERWEGGRTDGEEGFRIRVVYYKQSFFFSISLIIIVICLCKEYMLGMGRTVIEFYHVSSLLR